ncbi:MAG: tetratricopeptide repeat protein [candidate division Zixibacteria bacterium]|nr:tetratricopeptide repeat protein [Candidatus Tariuqbacter arcticus]
MHFNPLYFLLLIPIAILIWAAYTVKRRQYLKKQFPPFTQALTLLLAGDKRKALQKLRLTVKEDTNNISAYLLFGDILRDLGYHKQAAKIHKELTIRDRLKPDVQADIKRSLLMDYLLGSCYRPALRCADELLVRNKNDIWALNRKLEILEAIQDWRKAAETAKKIQSRYGKTDTEQLAMYKSLEGKRILANQGKEHDARVRFREAMKIDDKFPMSYLELASSYVREGRYKDAVKTWNQFFQNNPNLAYLAFGELEKTLFDLNRFEELETIYRNLVQSDSQNTRAVVALARFLHRKGSTEEAIRICQDGLEATPQSLWIRRNLFRFYAAEDRLQEAIELGLEVLDMVTWETEEFLCANCGYLAYEPLWKCPNCGKWRTFKF